MPVLLLLEDDVMVGSGIRLGLRQEGFEIEWIQDRLEAERGLQADRYAAIVLDIAFPRDERLNSMDWLRNRAGRVPIVVLTPRIQEDGACGVDLEELAARIRAELRTPNVGAQGTQATIALPFSWG